MRDLETRNYKLGVGTGAGRGTFIIIRNTDDATTDRDTGAVAAKNFALFEKAFNISGANFDARCARETFTTPHPITERAIDAALGRIGDYTLHPYCDSELDALLAGEASLLETYKTLLYSPQCENALTDKGRLIVEDFAEAAINSADAFATDMGITIKKENDDD